MNDKFGGGRAVAIGGVALIALAAGASAGFAATHHTSNVPARTAAVTNPPTQTSPPTPKTEHGRFFWFGGMMPGLGFGGAGGMLHGQVVVAKPGGGYETMDIQRGTVSSVSSSSITVKSSDGYSATYAVTGSTNVDAESAGISSVKTGDTVFVSAIVSGKTATAVSVLDESAISSGRVAMGLPALPKLPDTPQSQVAPNS